MPSTSVSKSHIKLFLYTKQKRNVAISDTKIDEIDTEKEIKIISHGWNEDKLAWYYPILTAALLKKGDYNVIQLDWSFYSRQVYLKAAENTRGVGKELVKISVEVLTREYIFAGYYVGTVIAKIHKERNVPLEKFHLIGHSLGSHVLGFAGKKVKELTGGKVRLITGLDPAGPEFEVPMREKNSRLSDDDAKIVEAIHTNIGLNGFVKPIGTIDFYVNGGGPAQPGCNGARKYYSLNYKIPFELINLFQLCVVTRRALVITLMDYKKMA